MTLLLYDRKRMARKIKILLPAFALILCSQARGEESYIDSVTAFFESRVITSLELRTETAIDRALFQGKGVDSSHLTRAKLLNSLPRLVRELLIDREALRFLEYETFGADVAESMRKVSLRPGAAEWSRFLTVSGLRETEILEMIARKLRVSAFEKKKLTSIPLVSPDLPFSQSEKKLVDQKRKELYERWVERLIKNAQVTYLTEHFR